jgi:hypothetical protein
VKRTAGFIVGAVAIAGLMLGVIELANGFAACVMAS